MRKALVENALRWMLAAWMLLATSFTSSTYVHGHSGGNLSHQHDRHDSTFSHSSVPTTFHDDHDSHPMLSAADVHRHGCVVLLGAIAYQPVSDKSSSSQEKLPCSWETLVVVSAAHGVRNLSKTLAIDQSALALAATISIGSVCELKQHELSCAGIALSFPLCDRARHERSGVLLA
jgi:hypothetical protein